MERRRVLGLTTGALGFHAGCLGLGQRDDCHCGHRGPPKGLYVNNVFDESRTVTIEVAAAGSDEMIYSRVLEVASGGDTMLDDIIEKSGSYQVTASTSDHSQTWTTTTDKCHSYFFMLEMRRDELVKRAVPCS